MKRYKIFTSLSTVSNNEITIESDEEMAAKTSVSLRSSPLGTFHAERPRRKSEDIFAGNMQLTGDFTVT